MRNQFILLATLAGLYSLLWLRSVAWGIVYLNPGEFFKHLGYSLLFGRDRTLLFLQPQYGGGRKKSMEVRGLIFHRRLTLALFTIGFFLATAILRWLEEDEPVVIALWRAFVCLFMSLLSLGMSLPKVFGWREQQNFKQTWVPTATAVAWSALAVSACIQLITASIIWTAVMLAVTTGVVSLVLVVYLSRRLQRGYNGQMTWSLIRTFVLTVVLWIGLGRLFPS